MSISTARTKSLLAPQPNRRLLLIVFLVVTGTSVVAPLLSRDAEALGSGPIGIAVLYSGFYIVRLIGAPAISRWSMKAGTKRVLVVGTILYPLLGTAYWAAHTTLVLLVVRLFHGIASAIMLPMASAYLSQGQDETDGHGRWMAWYQFSVYAAGACGPVLGGYLARVFSIRGAFLALTLLGLLGSIITLTLPPREDRKAKTEVKPSRGKLMSWDPRLLPLLALNFGLAVVDIYWVSFFPLRATQFALSIEAIGLLLGTINAIGALTQVPLTKYANRILRIRRILPGLAALALVFTIGMALPSRAWWLVMVIMLAIVTAILPTLTYTLASQFGQSLGSSSTIMVRLGMATSAGMIIGPLIFGLASVFSQVRSLTVIVMAGVWLVVFVLTWAFRTTIV